MCRSRCSRATPWRDQRETDVVDPLRISAVGSGGTTSANSGSRWPIPASGTSRPHCLGDANFCGLPAKFGSLSDDGGRAGLARHPQRVGLYHRLTSSLEMGLAGSDLLAPPTCPYVATGFSQHMAELRGTCTTPTSPDPTHIEPGVGQQATAPASAIEFSRRGAHACPDAPSLTIPAHGNVGMV